MAKRRGSQGRNFGVIILQGLEVWGFLSRNEIGKSSLNKWFWPKFGVRVWKRVIFKERGMGNPKNNGSLGRTLFNWGIPSKNPSRRIYWGWKNISRKKAPVWKHGGKRGSF